MAENRGKWPEVLVKSETKCNRSEGVGEIKELEVGRIEDYWSKGWR